MLTAPARVEPKISPKAGAAELGRERLARLNGCHNLILSNTTFRKPLQGMWIKAHFGYENYNATVSNPDVSSLTASQRLRSAIVGGMIGDTTIFGKDGGFARADSSGSDLETSYRVMRTYHMLKAKPARAGDFRAFVAKCRNADGGYGPQPGKPSHVGATYNAGIILHWLE